jgi:hypothetical protein
MSGKSTASRRDSRSKSAAATPTTGNATAKQLLPTLQTGRRLAANLAAAKARR